VERTKFAPTYKQEDGTKDMQCRKQTLSRKEAVRNHAYKKRRNHCGQRGGAVCESNLLAGEPQGR